VAGENDVTVSLPHIVGGTGIVDTLHPLLNSEETTELQASARLIREAIDSVTQTPG
jgi:malate/lactate dehydrogenase